MIYGESGALDYPGWWLSWLGSLLLTAAHVCRENGLRIEATRMPCDSFQCPACDAVLTREEACGIIYGIRERRGTLPYEPEEKNT